MTILSVVLQDVVYKRDFQPVDNLGTAIAKVMGAAEATVHSQLKEQRIVYTSSQEPIPTDNYQQRAVGSRDISVLAVAEEGQRLTAVETELQQVKQQLGTLTAAFQPVAAKHVRILATEILLHAAGRTDFYTTTTDYYAQMGAAHPGVQQVCAQLGVGPATFVDHADRIISRRHGEVHPGTLERLEAEVTAAQSTIDGTPALMNICKWECMVVQGYAAFKAAFPQRFS